MANTTNTARIVVDTTQAERALTGLQNSMGKLTGSFNNLKGLVAGFAVGSFITNIYRMADAIMDIHDATGITIQTIKGFQDTIKKSGGDAEGASTGITKFSQAIDTAASGSKEMQDTFLKLGIGLNELRNLSEEQLLTRVIDELGKMPPSAERAAMGIDLFGKAFRTVDFTKAAGGFAGYTNEANKSAPAIKAAADAQEALQSAMTKLQTALAIILQPISNFIVSISENQTQVNTLVKLLIQLTAAFVGLMVVSKVAQAIIYLNTLLVGTGTAGTTAAAGVTAAGTAVTGLGVAISRLVARLSFVVAGLMLINDVTKIVTGNSLVDWAEKAGVAMGLLEETSSDTAQSVAAQKAAEEANAERAVTAANTAREVQDAMQKERDALSKIIAGYKDANSAALEKLNADIQMIGASEKQKLAIEAVDAAYSTYMQNYIKLRDEYDAKSKSGSESERKMLPEIAAKMKELSDEYYKQKEAVLALSEVKAKALQEQQLELYRIRERISAENELQKIQDDIAKSTMSEIERKYYDIDAAAKASAKSAIEAEEARRGAPLSASEVQQYYAAAVQGSEKLKAATRAQYEDSRRFSTGWKKAFREYADNATNAAKQAERIFNKAMNGMEDLIVNFAKTGKFEWKTFVQDMLEELLRSQIQQTFSSMLGGIMDIFGIQGEQAGGRGANPNSPVYVADVTGGMGGGFGGMGGGFGGIGNMGGMTQKTGLGSIASGLGGLWDKVTGIFSSDNPISNTAPSSDWFSKTQAENFYEPWKNQQSSGGIWDSLTSSVGGMWDSVTSGIGGLFDGWFANGGTIGAGKFGIVGENGPEFVGGPATVTPMAGMGGVTNVTYNINAVDAPSFKQLVAQDPSFIYAVTMQGSKGIPSRR